MPAAKSGSWIILNAILFPLHGVGIDACSSFFYRLTNCKSSFTGKPSLAAVLNWEEYIFCLSCCIQFQLNTVLLSSILPVPFAIPLGACWAASTQRCGSIVAFLFLFFLAVIYKLSFNLLFSKVSCPAPCLSPYQRTTTAVITDSLLILCVFLFFSFSVCFDAFVVVYSKERVTGKTQKMHI